MALLLRSLFEKWRRFLRLNTSSANDDAEILVSSGAGDDETDVPSLVPNSNMIGNTEIMANQPRRTWTRTLIFCNLAIVVGTSFMSGFYMMAIAKPYGLYPHPDAGSFDGAVTADGQKISSRKSHALPLATLFFHHLLTYYASRLFAFIGTASFLGTKLGRRRTLMAGAVVGFLAVIIGLISQLCPTKTRDLLWAISTGMLGLQSGVGQIIAPAYLIEIAPISIRGACGCFYEAFFWAGVAFAFIAELDLPGNELALWTFVLGLSAAFYLIQFGMLWFGFESPHWLVHEAGRDQEAIFVIRHLRQCDTANALIELAEIKESVSDNSDGEPGSCCCPNNSRFACEFCKAKVVWPTFIGACLMSANLLTGAPIIYKIQTALLNKADLVGEAAEDYHFPLPLGIVLILLYLSIMAVVAIFLVDSIGRRRLVTIGMACMTVAYIPTALGTYYKDAITWQVGSVLFMASYSLGPGPIGPFMIAELFDHRSRLIASSIGHLVTQLFPVYLAEVYDTQAPYPQLFMPGGVIFCVLELVLLWLFLPETKLLPFNRIVEKFGPEKNWIQLIERTGQQRQQQQRETLVIARSPPSSSTVAPYYETLHTTPSGATISIQMTETTPMAVIRSGSSSGQQPGLLRGLDDIDSDVNAI